MLSGLIIYIVQQGSSIDYMKEGLLERVGKLY